MMDNRSMICPYASTSTVRWDSCSTRNSPWRRWSSRLSLIYRSSCISIEYNHAGPKRLLLNATFCSFSTSTRERKTKCSSAFTRYLWTSFIAKISGAQEEESRWIRPATSSSINPRRDACNTKRSAMSSTEGTAQVTSTPITRMRSSGQAMPVRIARSYSSLAISTSITRRTRARRSSDSNA